MKGFKNELDKAEFQVFRMKVAIKTYLEQCERMGMKPDRLNELLDILSSYIKQRDELKENEQ